MKRVEQQQQGMSLIVVHKPPEGKELVWQDNDAEMRKVRMPMATTNWTTPP